MQLATASVISPKQVASDFTASGMRWSILLPLTTFHLFSSIKLGYWARHVELPTRNNNILIVAFETNLKQGLKSVQNNLAGCDHSQVFCHLLLPPYTVFHQVRINHIFCSSHQQLSAAKISTVSFP